MMNVNDVQTVLKALHLAASESKTLDPDGDRSVALWVACLTVSEPNDAEPLSTVWPALVHLSREYVGLKDVIRATGRVIPETPTLTLVAGESDQTEED